MADQSVLSLFDETSNFLDDLTGAGGGEMAMSMGGDGMMGNQGNVMMLNSMVSQPQPVQQQPQGFQQQQQQQIPGQMHGMNQNQHGYNQYGAQQTQKLHHVTPNMAIPNQTPQGQGLTAQGMMSPQHSQFGSPPPTSPHVTRPPAPYSMSPMHNGPRMPQPQQMNQMNMNQGSGWNQQAQNGPNQQQMSQPQMFVQQQQQQQPNMQTAQNMQQQNMPHMVGQSTTYLSHHDYALPANQAPTQRLSHFPEPQQSQVTPGQPGQSFNMQTMSSPPGTNRLTHMPANSVNNNMNRMGGQMTVSTQSFPQSSQAVSLLGNTNMGQTQPLHHANFPSDMNMQQAQMNSGQQQMNNSQIQHFQYPNQQQNQNAMSQGVGETTPLTHFPNTSPTQNTQFHPQYPGMQQQQTRPAASPRPTPPPPSLTPTTPTQGSFPQATLQQHEQIMPANNANAIQSRVLQVSAGGQTLNVIKCVPNPSGGQNFQTVQNVSFAPVSAQNMQKISVTTLAPSVNTSIANRMAVPAKASPSGVVVHNQQMQQMNLEIQQLQQQIQQLYNMQQTPQTQQKMLDLQERMRSLKAQQQQQLLRERQMQQQQQQQLTQQSQQQKPQTKQIILTIQNPQQQKQVAADGQARPMIATSTPQGVQIQRIQLRPKAPQNVIVQKQPGQTVQSLLQPKQQVQVQTSQPQIIIQQKQVVQQSQQQQSKPILVTQLTQGDSQPQPQQIKVVTLTPQKTVQTVKTILGTPVTMPEKKSPTIMTPPSTTPTSQPQPPVSPQLNTPPTLTPQDSSGLPEPISPPEQGSSAEDDVDVEMEVDGSDRERLIRAQQAQEKANRIIQEALAKAQAAGNTSLRVIPSAGGSGDGKPEKEKKKKRNSSKKPKEPKEPKPPKEPKEKKTPKPKTPRPKQKSAKKKKPLPTFLQKKKKKKRKTGGMSDDSEPEQRSPVQSDKEEDDLFKRRSARNTKRKKYLDDLDLQLTDDEKSDDANLELLDAGGALKPQFFVENPAEEDAVIVEKILGMRTVKKQIPVMKTEEVHNESQSDEVDVEEQADKESKMEMETVEVEEFFVKYKNFSYLHCEWKPVEELKDKRIHSKIKRYKQKRLSMGTYFLQIDEDELFNPDYAEVDRILEESITTDPDTNEKVTYYMVKWRSLPYEDSTWELAEDVDHEKVLQFKRFQKVPTEEERQQLARPKPSEWKKLDESRIYKNDNTLREYQLEGVNWLTFCYYNKQNSILADEMGLGKTIQSITFLQEIYDYGIKGPFLVIAPLSTIGNWQREFETWTDLNVITYHGTAASRSMLQEYEMYLKDEDGHRIPDMYKFHAIITTYEVIISDVELLSSIEWRATVIDEAHRLKNQKCKLMEGLKVFDLEHRVLLTGTPLQNNVEELFSLLNFLEPSRFNNSEEFLKEFGDLKTESQVEKLKQLLKPRMLRRLKEDVEKNLAAKEETIVEVELTNIQKKYYRAILEKNFSFLSKGAGTAANVPNLMNTMMELRKCCNHPYLVNGAEEKIVEETKETHGADPLQLFMAMVKASGKLVLIDKLLPKLKAGNHKVLIFSQMIRVLDILEDYLIQRKYLYERIDGRIRGNLRQEAIDRFSKPDSDRFIFLLCTRAGGLGINLTAADTVIIFDSDWNPQNDLQAQARCHRIGQKKAVKVYRLITRNSYEREMFDRASMKLGLDKAVLQSMSGKKEDSSAQPTLSKKEIEDLLRKGAYGAIMDDENAGDQFCEEDIDLILRRRTQVIQIQSEGKGSTFAKASFSVSENRDDIDISDPNFWKKWAKKADIDTDAPKNELIMEQPRARRQTTRYGNQDLLDMSELDTTSDSSDEEEGAQHPSSAKGKGGKKGKGGRKKKKHKVDLDAENTPVEEGVYSRGEFFKVEKNLLIYGWGRWEDILLHGRFKRKLQVKDIQNITRALLVYSLKNYAGDERIKGFIWDLVNPQADKEFKNHSGLSAPVPRGRKGRKARTEASKLAENLQNDMANCDMNLDAILTDEGYQKHLQRHANKVLLRVRLLYYLKQEVIGDEAEKVFANYPASEIDIPRPVADGDPPIMWWDEEADKSLLIGVFKHGYEKFNIMRQDSGLCFLDRCGPPDGAALLREQNDEEDDPSSQQLNESKLLRDDEMDVDDDDVCPGTPGFSSQGKITMTPITYETADGKLPFPGPSELNTRLRRVITGYQRNHKKQQLKLQQKEKKLQRRERFEVQLKEREERKREMQQKWSRREESDFYRIVSTFGVQFDPHIRRYNWETFRQLARLEKKYDDTLTEYFLAFYYMCCRVCKKLKEDARPPNNLLIEPITEERANRCLARIDLLNKVREEVLLHPKLEERLELCQSSFDMPEWWVPGLHDKDLLIGAARHGLARTDYHILHDPTLSFREIVNNKDLYKSKQPLPFQSPSIPNADLDDTQDDNKSDVKPKPESESDMDTDMKPEVKCEVKCEKEEGEIDDDDDDDDGDERKVEVKAEVKEEEEESKEEREKRAMEKRVKAIEERVKAEIRAAQELRDESMDELDEKPLVFKPMLSGLDGLTPDASLLGDEDPAVAELMARSMMNPAIQWPKDRVIFHRLEHICFCVEKGEWPLTRRQPMVDSLESTPSGTPVPTKPDTPLGDSSRCDTPELYAQGDGLKLKIQKKRKRRKKDEIEAERSARLKELYGIQMDSDSQQDSLSGMRTPTDSLTNDTNDDTDNDRGDGSLPRLDNQPAIGRTVTPMFMGEGHKKRGRKRKMETMPDDHTAMVAAEKVALAMAQATAKKNMTGRGHKLITLPPDARIPVVNIEDGSRLCGEEAPTRLELEDWLDSHPGYMVDLPDAEPEVPFDQEFFIDKRKKRRPRLDPTKLDLENLTGEENVSVVNKLTGKRITGAKAPPLKHLAEWLTQNPNFFVDPKWAHLVKEKGNLPESLQSRILHPSEKRRGRPPNSNPKSPYPSASQMNALAMANSALGNPGLMANLPKLGMGIPFGALPNLGMNPMFNMAAFGLPMTTAGPTKTTNSESKNDNSDSEEKATGSAAAFPLMYNPMLYNSIIAAQMGNFSLPANIPTSFATLAQAQAQMLNGAAAAAAAAAAGKNNSDSEDNPEQMEAQDLSIKKSKDRKEPKPVKEKKKIVQNEIEEGEILNLATKKRCIEPEETKVVPTASKSDSDSESDDQS